MIAIDFETHLIAPYAQAPKAVCLSWWDREFNYGDGTVVGGDRMRWCLATQFKDQPWVGHNIAFDMTVAAANWPELLPDIFRAYEEDRITDTMIREKLLDIAAGTYRQYGYSLKELAALHLNESLDKDTWRLEYSKLDGVPLEQWPAGAIEYAKKDAEVTYRLWEHQEARAKGRLEDQYRQARAAFWLQLCSCWGLITDPEEVDAFKRNLESLSRELKTDLLAAGLLRPDRVNKKGKLIPGSRNVKAARALLDQALGPAAPKTKKGSTALDEEACLRSSVPSLADYARYSSVSKQLSTDVKLVESGTTQPIHARFDLLETGRVSSRPNIQNLPRKGKMRECFIPRPGFVFCSADYSGLELRTVAQVLITLFGRSKLADALNEGRDPHTEIAKQLGSNPGDSDFDSKRQVGKVANFGFPGGLGPERLCHFAKLSYGVELTTEQAKNLKRVWLDTWPEFRRYFAVVNRLIESEEPLEQLFSKRFRGGLTYCEAANSFFQGLGADVAKTAGWHISRECYDETTRPLPLLGSRIVDFVHDEFLLEVPEPAGHECSQRLVELMLQAEAAWLPDIQPAVGSPVLMRRWSKHAKPVYKNERLVPYGDET